ncbi:MAG: 50S ribosomal protein L33 [Thermomicrobiales bacterium]
MARRKADRLPVTMQSTESPHRYLTEKNRKNDPARLELRRYDPTRKRHVLYRETR